ncbi:hypothetical protein L1049_010091 [Liquidambar formosana]|uniref:Uncharacterized protein n=1 Tax=Liquidambar formosana TaxID=63359 RepID=A0AAP0R409_LIQFO
MVISSNEGGGNGNGFKKRVCGCSKADFLPEESFQSWGNYVKALGNTKQRFKDRLLARSLDHLELHEMRARSQHEMKKTLNWWDLIWFGVGAVMGAGIFVLTGEAARNDAGPAVPQLEWVGTRDVNPSSTQVIEPSTHAELTQAKLNFLYPVNQV